MSKNSGFIETGPIYCQNYVWSGNPGQNISHKIKKVQQNWTKLQKNMISNFAHFFTTFVQKLNSERENGN